MSELRDAIDSYVSGASDVLEITEYEVWLNGRAVTVRLRDGGPRAGRPKYSVEAFWSDLPLEDRHGGSRGYSLGHADETIATAVAGVHWDQFRSAS